MSFVYFTVYKGNDMSTSNSNGLWNFMAKKLYACLTMHSFCNCEYRFCVLSI